MSRGGPGTPWVAMRARNDMPLIERTLAALDLQDSSHRLLVLDNGSTDGTREAAARHADRVIDIPEGAYIPGRVLNLAMRETDGELVVFLNSDCEPAGPDWLGKLLAAMRADPAAAAAFGRQDPRPDCAPLMAKDTLMTFGDGARQARWRHCFSMASSCVRRSVWEKMPFSETLKYSEDIDWTWRARQAGHPVRYAADSAVLHSHNYSLRQLHKRQYGEGYADAEIFVWEPRRSGFLRFTLLPWGRLVLSDLAWCLRRLHVGAAIASPLVRAVMAAGRRKGFREGRLAAIRRRAAPSDLPFAPAGSPDFNRRFGAALDSLAERLDGASGGALAGFVLCGGYGRGEGAVLRGRDGREYAWNDVDLLPVARPGRLAELSGALAASGDAEAKAFAAEFHADLDIGRPIEEKTIGRLPPVLLWLETALGHRVIGGDTDLFARNITFDPATAPTIEEAEKLLLNRGAGLLMACAKASGRPVTVYDCSDADFSRRNAAKCSLALGDALLMAAGAYRTRVSARQAAFDAAAPAIRALLGAEAPDFDAIAAEYAFGLAFKADPGGHPDEPDRARLAALARFWLACYGAVEGARSGAAWQGPEAFARRPGGARPIEPAEHRGPRALARNLVHNLRRRRLSLRYPREDLFRELPLLLAAFASPGRLPDPARMDAFIGLWKRYN